MTRTWTPRCRPLCATTDEVRARNVPDEMVSRGLSRSLPDNTASIATWLDAREPSREGDLTRKRSRVVADTRSPVVATTVHAAAPLPHPRMLRILRFGSACHRSTHAGHRPFLLTDLLTRLLGTGETARDTGDAQRILCLVSETRRNGGDGGDARRMAHNPATAGFLSPAVANTRPDRAWQRQPHSHLRR